MKQFNYEDIRLNKEFERLYSLLQRSNILTENSPITVYESENSYYFTVNGRKYRVQKYTAPKASDNYKELGNLKIAGVLEMGSEGVIKSSGASEGSTGYIIDTEGIRGYHEEYGKVFDIPTDGSAPFFSSGRIVESDIEIYTSGVIKTSGYVGVPKEEGSSEGYDSGVLINNTGIYATEEGQSLADASVKILPGGIFKVGGTNDYIELKNGILKQKINTILVETNDMVLDSEKKYLAFANAISQSSGDGIFMGMDGEDYAFRIGQPDIKHFRASRNDIGFYNGSTPIVVINENESKLGSLSVSGALTIQDVEGAKIIYGLAGEGANGYILDKDGIRGYDDVLGETFNLPTDGSKPTFSSGIIKEVTFEMYTSGIIKTSANVGVAPTYSAGVLINNTGIYACKSGESLSNASTKIQAGILQVGDPSTGYGLKYENGVMAYSGTIKIFNPSTAFNGGPLYASQIADDMGWSESGGIRTYTQSTTPTGDIPEGSIWFNTSQGDKMYVYSSGWTPYQTSIYNKTTLLTEGGIYTGTVTAGQVNAQNLSAISSNIGTVTAGVLQSSAQDFILNMDTKQIKIGSATSFTSGTGVFAGLESGNYKFRIGNPSASRMQWDGAKTEIYNSLNQVVFSSITDDINNVDLGNLGVKGNIVLKSGGAFKTSTNALNGEAGVVINLSGIFAGTSGQTTGSANVRIMNDGSAYFTGDEFYTGSSSRGLSFSKNDKYDSTSFPFPTIVFNYDGDKSRIHAQANILRFISGGQAFIDTSLNAMFDINNSNRINSYIPHKFHNNVGFYGATPISKPTSIPAIDNSVVDTTYGTEEMNVINNCRSRINDLYIKLQNLGLIS